MLTKTDRTIGMIAAPADGINPKPLEILLVSCQAKREKQIITGLKLTAFAVIQETIPLLEAQSTNEQQ